MATAKHSSATKPAPGEKIHILPLAKVKADFEWNARHGIISADSGDEEKNNFSDLMASIESEGQDTAVIVRPVGKSGENFALIAGFRRYAAIEALAKKQNNKAPTIKAVVREMSDLEARSLNIRENAARDDLRGPDLAWSIHELEMLYKAKGLKSSSVVIAASIGKNQGYVNKLMRIMNETEPKVTKLWRDAPFQVPIADMEKIATYEKDRQLAAFEEITKNKTGSGGQGAGGGRGKWLEAAETKAASVGTLLGALAKAGAIDADNLNFTDAEHIRLCVKFKPDATEKQVQKVGNALDTAYEAAVNAEDPAPEGEAPASKKGKNGRARAEA